MSGKYAMVLPLLFLGGCSFLDPTRATVDFNALSSDMTEAQVMAANPHLSWKCDEDKQNNHLFGQRVCDGVPNSINDAPASRIDYMFRDGHLSAVLAEYPPDSYLTMRAGMESRLGKSTDGTPRTPVSFGTDQLTTWHTKGGLVMTSRTAKNGQGNVIVAWISNREMNRWSGG